MYRKSRNNFLTMSHKLKKTNSIATQRVRFYISELKCVKRTFFDQLQFLGSITNCVPGMGSESFTRKADGACKVII